MYKPVTVKTVIFITKTIYMLMLCTTKYETRLSLKCSAWKGFVLACLEEAEKFVVVGWGGGPDQF